MNTKTYDQDCATEFEVEWGEAFLDHMTNRFGHSEERAERELDRIFTDCPRVTQNYSPYEAAELLSLRNGGAYGVGEETPVQVITVWVVVVLVAVAVLATARSLIGAS